MDKWITEFLKNDYNSTTVFVWVLFVWLLVFVVLSIAKRVSEKDSKFSERVIAMQGSFYMVGFAAFVVFGILVPVDVYVTYFGDRTMSSNPGEWGPIGDFFGGILNPILAFASFLALLYTIRIQSEELRLTRKEFEKSVEAQKKIAGVAEKGREQSLLLEDYRYASNLLREELSSLQQIFDKPLNLRADPQVDTKTPPNSLSAIVGRISTYIAREEVQASDDEKLLRCNIHFKLSALNTLPHNKEAIMDRIYEYSANTFRLFKVLKMYLELCIKLEIDIKSQLVQKYDCKDAARHLAYTFILSRVFDGLFQTYAFEPTESNLTFQFFNEHLIALGLTRNIHA